MVGEFNYSSNLSEYSFVHGNYDVPSVSVIKLADKFSWLNRIFPMSVF
jgi:hypothetical protein